jgi:hypothetical protein
MRISAGYKSLLLITSLSIIVFCSCSRYQYIGVDSKLYQNEKKEFVNENDTVILKYTFAGENLPVTISIYNKLLQPVYIDLTRSTVVLNNIQLQDVFYREGQSGFIAPLSYVTLTSNPIMSQFIDVSSKDTFTKKPMETSTGTIFTYDEKTTPLYFRSILALSPNEDYSNPTFFDYSFWVSTVLQTIDGPGSITYNPLNQFYIRKNTGFGKFLGFTTLSALVIIGLSVPGQGY